MYLRCLACDKPRSCGCGAFHGMNTAILLSAQPLSGGLRLGSPTYDDCQAGVARVPVVEQQLVAHDEFLVDIREPLLQAQGTMKAHHDS